MPGNLYSSQTIPTPELNVTSSNGNLNLAWIVPSTDFVLQQNPDLTTANWTDVPDAPTLDLIHLQNQVILPSSGSNGFYRLKTP